MERVWFYIKFMSWEFKKMSKAWKSTIILLSLTTVLLAIIPGGCATPSQNYVDLNKKLVQATKDTVARWESDRKEASEIAKRVKEIVVVLPIRDEDRRNISKELDKLEEIPVDVLQIINQALSEAEKVNNAIEGEGK